MRNCWFVRLESFALPFAAFSDHKDAQAFADAYERSLPGGHEGSVEIYLGCFLDHEPDPVQAAMKAVCFE